MRKSLVAGMAMTCVLLIGVHYLRGEPADPREAKLTIRLQTVKLVSGTVIEGTIGDSTFQTPSLTVNVGEESEWKVAPLGGQVQFVRTKSKSVITAKRIEVGMANGKLGGSLKFFSE